MKKSSIKDLSVGLAAFLSLGGLIGLGSTLTGGAIPVSATAVAPTEGDGSSANPYQIATAGNLEWFRDQVNGSTPNICGTLTADIDCQNTTIWSRPIGYNSGANRFGGVFDGANHAITNLEVKTSTFSVSSLNNYCGLFGYVTGTVKNLTLRNSTISSTVGGSDQGFFAVGGIAAHLGSNGDMDHAVLNCHVENTTVSCTLAHTYVGGVVGFAAMGTRIEKSSSEATVTGLQYVAGIASVSGATITDCYNAGNVTCTGSSNCQIGGIAGSTSGPISNCYNYGTISSGSGTRGALVAKITTGSTYSGSCTKSYYLNTSYSGARGASNVDDATNVMEPLTAAQFKDKSNFKDWDFGPTWHMGDDRPLLGAVVSNIVLDSQSAGTAGTEAIYHQKNGGFFTDAACTNQMSTSGNAITVPTKAYHTFNGYFTGENGAGTKYIDENGRLTSEADPDAFPDGGTLYASWTLVGQVVNITGGAGIKSVYISSDVNATTGEPSGSGMGATTTVYGFVELDAGYKAKDGWTLVSGTANTEGAKYRVTDGTVVGDQTVELGTFAADLITYSIAYELDGGSVATANPTSYTIESEAITLTNPTKEHCEFAGWTGTDLATPSMNVTIPSGSIGDREYTAHWTPMIAVLETSGTQYVYDGNNHSITGISFKNALTNEEIDCDVKFSDNNGSTYTLNDAPSFSEVGEHTLYYRASKNGYVTLDGTIALTISKAPLDFTAPTAVDGLIYDGNDHELITAGSANVGDVLYAANTSGALPEEASFSSAIPTGNAATTYYVFYKATGDAHYAEIPASLENKVTVTIQKLESTMTAPTPKLGLVYTGEAQDLVTAGSTNAGEMQYAVNTTGELPDAGDFSAVIPTGTAPATYHVFYRTTGDATHDAIPASSDNKVTVTITKLQSTLEAPKAKLGLIYDGTAQNLVTAGSTNAGEMLYAANTSGELPNDASFSSTIPTGTAAATYYVFYKTTGDLTHDAIAASLESKVTVVIAAAGTTYEAPKAKVGLLYTGESQELITAGSTEAGTMLYAVNTTGELPSDDQFAATIPTGKSVATYYVFYKTTGDANHAPVAASLDNKVTVKIARVDRSEAEKANKEASDYLDTLKNDSKFADIVSTLEGARNKLVAEAITADDVTEAEIAASVAVLRDAIEAAKVSVVEVLIDAIGNLSYDGGKNDSLKDINAAKAAYDALTDAQKAKVASAKVTTLNHDIEVYSHVDPVGKMIAALPTPASEQSYYDAVDAAKAAYDALTAEERALLDASFGYKKILEDNVAAKEVIMTISEIGEVSYDEVSEEKINAARKAYDSLSDEAKAKIDPKILGVLTNAEKEYSSLANYNKIAAITLTFVSGAAFLCGFLWLLLVPLRKKDDDKDDDDGNGPKKAKAA